MTVCDKWNFDHVLIDVEKIQSKFNLMHPILVLKNNNMLSNHPAQKKSLVQQKSLEAQN